MAKIVLKQCERVWTYRELEITNETVRLLRKTLIDCAEDPSSIPEFGVPEVTNILYGDMDELPEELLCAKFYDTEWCCEYEVTDWIINNIEHFMCEVAEENVSGREVGFSDWFVEED